MTIATSTGCGETFVVQIRNTQNATWQGTVTWTSKKKSQSFRSELELIKLIDSALEASPKPTFDDE